MSWTRTVGVSCRLFCLFNTRNNRTTPDWTTTSQAVAISMNRERRWCDVYWKIRSKHVRLRNIIPHTHSHCGQRQQPATTSQTSTGGTATAVAACTWKHRKQFIFSNYSTLSALNSELHRAQFRCDGTHTQQTSKKMWRRLTFHAAAAVLLCRVYLENRAAENATSNMKEIRRTVWSEKRTRSSDLHSCDGYVVCIIVLVL